jgi:hypothetical protein
MKIFKDPLNTAVFTTKYVVREKREITLVTHDIDDGAWQFLSNDINDPEFAMVVSFGEIIDIDKTVLEIADLPEGCTATRKSKNDEWVINSGK